VFDVSTTKVIKINITIVIMKDVKNDWKSLSSLAERLMWARKMRGLTQMALAKKADIKSQGTIGNLESGERKEPRDIVNIAAALDIDVTWLSNGEGSPFKEANRTQLRVIKVDDSPDYVSPKILNKLISLLAKTNLEGQETILEHAEEISPHYLKSFDLSQEKEGH